MINYLIHDCKYCNNIFCHEFDAFFVVFCRDYAAIFKISAPILLCLAFRGAATFLRQLDYFGPKVCYFAILVTFFKISTSISDFFKVSVAQSL